MSLQMRALRVHLVAVGEVAFVHPLLAGVGHDGGRGHRDGGGGASHARILFHDVDGVADVDGPGGEGNDHSGRGRRGRGGGHCRRRRRRRGQGCCNGCGHWQ